MGLSKWSKSPQEGAVTWMFFLLTLRYYGNKEQYTLDLLDLTILFLLNRVGNKSFLEILATIVKWLWTGNYRNVTWILQTPWMTLRNVLDFLLTSYGQSLIKVFLSSKLRCHQETHPMSQLVKHLKFAISGTRSHVTVVRLRIKCGRRRWILSSAWIKWWPWTAKIRNTLTALRGGGTPPIGSGEGNARYPC